MSTKTALVEELEKRNTGNSMALAAMIRRAREGAYHDFESTQATPKVNLVRDLKAFGFNDLVTRVMQGDFDE